MRVQWSEAVAPRSVNRARQIERWSRNRTNEHWTRSPRITPSGGTTTTTMDLYCMDKKLSELGEHDFDELLDTGVFAPVSQTVSSLPFTSKLGHHRRTFFIMSHNMNILFVFNGLHTTNWLSLMCRCLVKNVKNEYIWLTKLILLSQMLKYAQFCCITSCHQPCDVGLLLTSGVGIQHVNNSDEW